ncbi:MAG: hypothetical protein HKN91_03475 [Acidimicrobiia bacterium]|nr:hypothetical protein [Acidimicrobiia bacterium]
MSRFTLATNPSMEFYAISNSRSGPRDRRGVVQRHRRHHIYVNWRIDDFTTFFHHIVYKLRPHYDGGPGNHHGIDRTIDHESRGPH